MDNFGLMFNFINSKKPECILEPSLNYKSVLDEKEYTLNWV